jgi:2,5-furandicarboxylate decarboxylase 1
VNIGDPDEIEWAIATRFQADKDLVVVADAQGSKLDPSSRNGISAKMGLDATTPLEAPPLTFKRIRVKGEDDVDLARDLQADAAGACAQLGIAAE